MGAVAVAQFAVARAWLGGSDWRFLSPAMAGLAATRQAMAQNQHLGAGRMSVMLQILDAMALASAWFWALPRSLLFFIYGVIWAYTIAAGGYVLARSGIKPLWILAVIVPTLNLIALYVWAWRRWPMQNIKNP
jgi:hypothetical protein